MLHEVPTVRPQLARAHAPRCAHCGRPLTHPGTVIAFVGVVGPECRHKFTHLIALVAEVEMLSFNIDDQGSQRLAHLIWSRLCRLGFVVTKHADTTKRTLWLEVDSRVSRKGADVVKRYETVRAEFEQQLKLAQAEREAVGA
ncbi:hypothetical protein [Deinococcus frigens]|uniref:hypothetical protein n=1 Tax=Deinococcus frigens TaxID=249403 RepID=UPI00049619CA|nr:hypothetical protein [Deinococcus frigens]